MTASTTYVSGAILTAANMNSLAWGIVDTTAGGTSSRGFVNKTDANYAITTSTAAITGLTITWTPVTGRLYKASYSLRTETLTSQYIFTRFNIGATVYAAKADLLPANSGSTITNFVVFTGLSASTTLTVNIFAQTTAVGTTLVSGTVENANTFTVEDIGPST